MVELLKLWRNCPSNPLKSIKISNSPPPISGTQSDQETHGLMTTKKKKKSFRV